MGLFNKIKDVFKKPVKIPYQDFLVEEAEKWIGITEDNPGVDNIRKAVNDSADGEPWCVAFVMYCARSVGLRFNVQPSLYMTELAYDLWHKSPKGCRLSFPEKGCIVVWNYPDTLRGHAGIVTEITGEYLYTIEGNTSRDGKVTSPRGVFRRLRTLRGGSGMKVLGFLKPFI